jgi:hypothetical protein
MICGERHLALRDFAADQSAVALTSYLDGIYVRSATAGSRRLADRAGR